MLHAGFHRIASIVIGWYPSSIGCLGFLIGWDPSSIGCSVSRQLFAAFLLRAWRVSFLCRCNSALGVFSALAVWVSFLLSFRHSYLFLSDHSTKTRCDRPGLVASHGLLEGAVATATKTCLCTRQFARCVLFALLVIYSVI